jgi:hypothetical protein
MPVELVDRAARIGRSIVLEAVNFRVEYPIEIVAGAEAPGSLRYHLYSDRLFMEDQDFDSEGVPRKIYRVHGAQYNPLFVAWWALHQLELAARELRSDGVPVFRKQLAWLKGAAVTRGDGAIVWPCYFDWREGRAILRSPWISAMYQGVVMSALVRGFRLTGDGALLDLALGATRVFDIDVANGGVRSLDGERVLYEEYPAFPLPRVLDGFLFSLVGLYDLYAETRDARTLRMFRDGLSGLEHHLGRWSYRGKWSWYGSHGYLCPPHYHSLNRALLLVLHRLTAEPYLRVAADQWDPRRLSRRDRAEIFFLFVLTKNLARVRLRLHRPG